MLHGRTKPSRVWQKVREKDENIKANLIQYNVQHLYLDIFVSDFSNCPLSEAVVFDAIITDRKYLLKLEFYFRKTNFYSEKYLRVLQTFSNNLTSGTASDLNAAIKDLSALEL
jgi:tRNA G10  N-methylase Trm11